MHDQLKPLIQSEMEELASYANFTREESCTFLNESADEVVENASLKKILPAVYAVLSKAEN